MITFWRIVRIANLVVLGAPLVLLLSLASLPLLLIEWFVEPVDLWLARKAGDDGRSIREDQTARVGILK